MLIVGNWKMNGGADAMAEFGRMIAKAPEASARGVELVVCPPAVFIGKFADRGTVSPVKIGAQDCHHEPAGAFTGDVSAEMLALCGATHVILGHSERRSGHGETDEAVAAKVRGAQRAGLTAIVCVGESEAQRDAGEAMTVVSGQLNGSLPDSVDPSRLVVAYEPVWAIGTSRTPGNNDIEAMHRAIGEALSARFDRRVPVLYGGSVKPSNAGDILAVAGVGGALVGGASLAADDFLAIALAAPLPAAA